MEPKREYKFRVWHPDVEHMFYPNDEGEFIGEIDGERVCSDFGYSDLLNPSIAWPYVGMQYIGLKDKKGVDIYEGDIVKSKSHNPSTYVIEFIEGGFCATNPTIAAYPTDINHFYPSVGCDIEVIGNIYQNPELCPET